ncbi:response regulator [Halobacterium yunchengense]|uniref:response regulator n=1 Tax=Halobacterium yunchengense TaxID=3108497 RepID=UPI003AB53EAD
MRAAADQGDGDAADVLFVEDNPGDVRLAREAFAEGDLDSDLHVVSDGEAALSFLERRGEHADAPRPDVVLLDLNLPKVDGLEVLERVKRDDDLQRIPVVVLTGSAAEEDVARSYERRANAYLAKPVDPAAFADLVRSFERFWLTLAELPPDPD